MKSVEGAFVGFSEDALTLSTENRETSVPRAEVARVSLKENSRRKRNMLIGLGIGGAAGTAALGIWAAKAQPRSEFRGDYYDIGKWVFVPAGLGAGAAIGAAAPGFETIYRKRPGD